MTIKGDVYKQAPGLWFGDVIDTDPEAEHLLLECVNEASYAEAVRLTIEAVARARQRRALFRSRSA